jgi:very-short-patch-repair endonuclease
LVVKFRRQFNIGPYIADFYAPRAKLVVEFDGESHDDPAAKSYDQERDNYMTALGLRVLRFTNQDFEDHFDNVLSVIQSHITAGADSLPLLTKEGVRGR